MLQEEAVETLLKRLREDNKDLIDLLEYTRPVETMKVPETTANAKGYERIRDNARNLYHLLKHSFTWPCGCIIPHNASVHLQYRTCRELALVSTESKAPFDVLFFFETEQSMATAIPPWIWRETIIEPLEIPSCETRHMSHEESPQIRAMASFTASATTNTRTSAIVAATGFSLSAIGGSTVLNCFDTGHGQGNNIAQAAQTGGLSSQVTTSRPKNSPAGSTPRVAIEAEDYSSQMSTPSVPSERIESLCRAMLGPLNLPHLGIIVDDHKKQHRILVTKASHSTDTLRTVSLKSLLAQGLPKKKDRLILGVKLTSSLLQLHNTPWLAESWGSPDVLFMTNDDNPLLDKPWLSKHFPSPTCTILPRQSTGQPLCAEVRNQSMFALGVVLIELWFGKPLENLREMIDLGPRGEANAVTDFATTRRLSEAIYNDAGEWYGDAVRRCIYSDFNQRYTSLDTETLKEAVHRGVVLPLESHLSLFCGGNASEILPLVSGARV